MRTSSEHDREMAARLRTDPFHNPRAVAARKRHTLRQTFARLGYNYNA